MKDLACTTDGVTFYLQSEFEKLSFQDQALSILHERIHALYPQISKIRHYNITSLISALDVLLNYSVKQTQGDYSRIKDEEFEVINQGLDSAVRIGLMTKASLNNMAVCQAGGGVFYGFKSDDILQLCNLENQNFVSVGSMFRAPKDEEYKRDIFKNFKEVVVLHSYLQGSIYLAQKVNLTDTEVFTLNESRPVLIRRGARISHSNVTHGVAIGERASIRKSDIVAGSVIGANSVVEDSYIYAGNIGENSILNSVRLVNASVGNRVQGRNFTIETGFNARISIVPDVILLNGAISSYDKDGRNYGSAVTISPIGGTLDLGNQKCFGVRAGGFLGMGSKILTESSADEFFKNHCD